MSQEITKENLLNLVGDFTWFWDSTFFIETSIGNFIWSDPNYLGGTNIMKPYNGTYKQFLKSLDIPYGRSKGKHIISDYCGIEFILIGNI